MKLATGKAEKKTNGTARAPKIDRSPVVVTGGAGFIGTNVVHRLLSAGQRVIIYDNLSRPGVEKNLEWLADLHGSRLEVETADVRDAARLKKVIRGASHVFHFAAQVAVTTSLDDPVSDFEVNARGTINVLEAIRGTTSRPSLVFTSTNKVYGDLVDLDLVLDGDRYNPRAQRYARHGVNEDRPLSFHSPYGCSKGAADQYVVDYARSYGFAATVFRMSCIYGPHQFGTEDQGWVAHFVIRTLEQAPITLYGDGRQVRDVLFVEDLVDAFLLARDHPERFSGQAYNIGGGAENAISLIELVRLLGTLTGSEPRISFSDWRTGDQRYYVSDFRAFQAQSGWSPSTGVEEGVGRLVEWLQEFREIPAPSDVEQPLVRFAREAAVGFEPVSGRTTAIETGRIEERAR